MKVELSFQEIQALYLLLSYSPDLPALRNRFREMIQNVTYEVYAVQGHETWVITEVNTREMAEEVVVPLNASRRNEGSPIYAWRYKVKE